MTDDEAQAMLAQLTEHFGEPVMPIRRYCDGLRAWQQALTARAERKRAELFPGIDGDYHRDPSLKPAAEKAWKDYNARQEERANPLKWYSDAGKEPDARCYALEDLRRYEAAAAEVEHVFLQISKSNLLARVLYGGEKVREKMCPEHKGKWNGQAMLMGCEHGCHGTGWLPETETAK